MGLIKDIKDIEQSTIKDILQDYDLVGIGEYRFYIYVTPSCDISKELFSKYSLSRKCPIMINTKTKKYKRLNTYNDNLECMGCPKDNVVAIWRYFLNDKFKKQIQKDLLSSDIIDLIEYDDKFDNKLIWKR